MGLSPLDAYFDTNAFDHLHKRIGVTETDVQLLRDLIKQGKVKIRLSIINIEEILGAAGRASEVAIAELELIRELCGFDEIIKPHDMLVMETIVAHANGASNPSPFMTLSRELRSGLDRLLDVKGNREQILAVGAEVRSQIATFRTGMKQATKEVRNVAKRIPPKDRPSFEKSLADLEVPFAEGLADRAGALRACQGRGINALLNIRLIRLLVAANLSLTYAYTFEKREPQQGDSRDQLHVVGAATARIFVTADPQFGRLMKRVPLKDFDVLALDELVAKLRSA